MTSVVGLRHCVMTTMSKTSTTRHIALTTLWFLAAIGLIALNWSLTDVQTGQLLYDVPHLAELPELETPFLYLIVNGLSLLFPLLLSFDGRVHYYTRWRRLFPAIAIVGGFFIVWDVIFTAQEVWGFNPRYYYEPTKLLGLPLGEWLFFLVVPYCSIFIYSCLNYYVPRDVLGGIERWISIALIALCLIIGVLWWEHRYTATTFLLTGAFVGWQIWYYPRAKYRSRFYLAYLVTVVPFCIVNGILTGLLTAEPIVVYNPDEYLGIRLVSIPLDDLMYGFLLLFGIVTLMEGDGQRNPNLARWAQYSGSWFRID